MGMATGGLSRTEESLATDHTDLTEEELFQILANQRRRHVLHLLMREDRPVDIGELARELAAWEDDVSPEEVTSKDRKRVYTALQQSHLPKLDKADIVDFDGDRGTVEPTPALEDVEIYIDVVRGREIPWSNYYLGITAIATVVLGGAALGVPPFSALPTFAWHVFVIVTFAVSAGAHRYYERRNRLGIEGEFPEFDLTSEGSTRP